MARRDAACSGPRVCRIVQCSRRDFTDAGTLLEGTGPPPRSLPKSKGSALHYMSTHNNVHAFLPTIAFFSISYLPRIKLLPLLISFNYFNVSLGGINFRLVEGSKNKTDEKRYRSFVSSSSLPLFILF